MMAHLFPHPRRAEQLILSQKWNAVTYALDGWRKSTGADRAYFRRLALHEIAAFRLAEAGRP